MSPIIISLFLFSSIAVYQIVQSQNTPGLIDEKYLDIMQSEIKKKVEETEGILVQQARFVEVAAKNFAASKAKESMLMALRYLAETVKMESLAREGQIRQPRQDQGDDEEEEDADEEVESEGSTTKRTSSESVISIFPALSNILKTIQSGNVTSSADVLRNVIAITSGAPPQKSAAEREAQLANYTVKDWDNVLFNLVASTILR